MTELSAPMRVKRGLHRVGLALSILLGAFAFVGGAMFSWDSANSQREQFLARQCVVNETKRHSFENPWIEELLEIECHSPKPSAAELEELRQSVNSGFSFTATLASYLAVTALITGLVSLATYFSVSAFSWIVRGFMGAD